MATKPATAETTVAPVASLSFADAAEKLLRAIGKPLSHKELSGSARVFVIRAK